MTQKWIDFAERLQALAQAGLNYSKNKFELERFAEIREISAEMMAHYTETDMDKVMQLFANESGYQTPKVDVRGVIFHEGKLLLVQEESDDCWSLPGGWADVGYSPVENVIKEVAEEAGLTVKPGRLLAVLDMKKHAHPPAPYHIYKIFIRCEWLRGQLSGGLETKAAAFFARDRLPVLSLRRITQQQIELLFSFYDEPDKVSVIE